MAAKVFLDNDSLKTWQEKINFNLDEVDSKLFIDKNLYDLDNLDAARTSLEVNSHTYNQTNYLGTVNGNIKSLTVNGDVSIGNNLIKIDSFNDTISFSDAATTTAESINNQNASTFSVKDSSGNSNLLKFESPTNSQWLKNLYANGNVTVKGNVTVNGTTFDIVGVTVNVADNIITLNSDKVTGVPSENGGLEVERGTLNNAKLSWNETDDDWELDDGTGTGAKKIIHSANISSYSQGSVGYVVCKAAPFSIIGNLDGYYSKSNSYDGFVIDASEGTRFLVDTHPITLLGTISYPINLHGVDEGLFKIHINEKNNVWSPHDGGIESIFRPEIPLVIDPRYNIVNENELKRGIRSSSEILEYHYMGESNENTKYVPESFNGYVMKWIEGNDAVTCDLNKDGTRLYVARMGYGVYLYKWHSLHGWVCAHLKNDYVSPAGPVDNTFACHVSVSEDEKVMVIGNRSANGAGTNPSSIGQAYIFYYDESKDLLASDGNMGWVQRAIINAPDNQAYFGNAVAISGDGNVLFISALHTPNNNPGVGTSSNGVVHVYDLDADGVTWNYREMFTEIDGSKATAAFGAGLSTNYDGSKVAVLSARDDNVTTSGTISERGSVTVWNDAGNGTWYKDAVTGGIGTTRIGASGGITAGWLWLNHDGTTLFTFLPGKSTYIQAWDFIDNSWRIRPTRIGSLAYDYAPQQYSGFAGIAASKDGNIIAKVIGAGPLGSLTANRIESYKSTQNKSVIKSAGVYLDKLYEELPLAMQTSVDFTDATGISTRITGSAMSHDGSTIAVSPYSSNTVEIFKWNGDVWMYDSQIRVPDIKSVIDTNNKTLSPSAINGGIALNNDGAVCVIGYDGHDGYGGVETGLVVRWEYSGGTWNQVGTILEPQPGGSATNSYLSNLGRTLSLTPDGNTLVVGSPSWINTSDVRVGKSEVFTWTVNLTVNKWVQRGSDIEGDSSSNRFGGASAITDDGNTLFLGEIRDSGSAQIRTFNWSGNDWEEGYPIEIDYVDSELANYNLVTKMSCDANADVIVVGNAARDIDYNQANFTPWGEVVVLRKVHDVYINVQEISGFINGSYTGNHMGQGVDITSDASKIFCSGDYTSKTLKNMSK